MKRITLISIIALLLSCFLGSCLVVSLQPLGSEKERIKKPEIIGTWSDPNAFSMLIITKHPKNSIAQYKIKKVTNTQKQWIRSRNGRADTTTIAEVNKLYEQMPDSLKEKMYSFINSAENMARTMQEAGKQEGRAVSNSEQISRKVMFNDFINLKDDSTVFSANIFSVGNELYLDMFGYGSDRILENFLPVHSFTKLSIEGGKLSLTYLDGEKMADLFEEKRIRLGHQTTEEGVTLITAGSDEIKSFLKKYTKDSSVFGKSTTYSRQ